MEEPQAPPRVSVIVVSYNCAEALRRRLTALEGSAERDKIEILVVDNGSLDETPSVAAEFPKAILLKLPRNFGLTKALNIGMRTAKGEFYFYLSPYVEVQPETVSALAARLEAERDAVAVCPLVVSMEGQAAPELFRLPAADTVGRVARAGMFSLAAPPDLDRQQVAVEFPALSALMVRSYFLKGLRHIDERYAQTWGDAEIALQIRRAAKKILLYPGLRVTRFDEPDAMRAAPPAVRALLAADWVSGASVYAGKHFGLAAGLKVRLAAIVYAFFAIFGLRDLSFRLSRFLKLLSAAKVDGTQTVL